MSRIYALSSILLVTFFIQHFESVQTCFLFMSRFTFMTF